MSKIIKNKKHIIDNITGKKNIFSIRNNLLKKAIIIFILTIIPTSLLLIVNKNINLELLGNSEENIEVFSEYTDPGFNATFFNKNINRYIITQSNLNPNDLGTYSINYKIPYLKKHTVKRNVNVVDTTKPEIIINGKETINIYINEQYQDEGVTIKDNYDKDLTDKLVINNNLNTKKSGKYEIVYTVTDSSGNTNSKTRTINVKEKIYNNCSAKNSIEEFICKNNYRVSIGYVNLVNNKTYYYKQNQTYYGASLIKTLDALYIYEKNMLNDTLKEHIKKAISVSDNDSHHYLVNHIGFHNLKQYGISIGAKNTLIGGDNYGITTVNDQINVMKKLYEITKDNQNEELKSFFINSKQNYLRFNGCPTMMHKYGNWEQVYHDAGIVLDEEPYIVVILTSEGYRNYPRIVSTLSQLIYEYHKSN